MLRKATEADFLALIAFRCAACGCTRTAAAGWVKSIIGLENILLLEKADENKKMVLAAMLAAVPIRTGYHHGVWLTGLATRKDLRGQGVMSKLLDSCLRAYAENGCDFAITTLETEKTGAWMKEMGFQPAFSLRVVAKPIIRNLLAQADFDTMTVHRLIEARLNYQPGCILLPEHSVAEMIRSLYGSGMTLVSNPRGYGMYYQKGDTLQFVEMQADNDHAAEILMQAAREKTGADRAKIILAENQALFMGEGKRAPYAMIRFLKQPFPLADIYFRLLV